VRFAGIRVFLSMLTIGCGPFGLLGAFVAQELWMWFAAPYVSIATPTFGQFYFVCAVFGFFRAARYVTDGTFDWKDAVTSSVVGPLLLLIAGFLVYFLISRFRH
jgi:hypothetical protein